jgi:hypothetical protein
MNTHMLNKQIFVEGHKFTRPGSGRAAIGGTLKLVPIPNNTLASKVVDNELGLEEVHRKLDAMEKNILSILDLVVATASR